MKSPKNSIHKEIYDEFYLDLNTLRKKKINSKASVFRSLNDKLKQCAFAAQSAMTFANQNQQNSKNANNNALTGPRRKTFFF